MSVIEASCAGFKDMADGTIRFYFDVEPRNAGAALELFRVRGTPAALAALKQGHAAVSEPAAEEPVKAEKPKGGPLSKLAGVWCGRVEFWEWLGDVYGYEVKDKSDAALAVRLMCGVDSRSELDHDQLAAELFNSIIRGPFSKHLIARGITL